MIEKIAEYVDRLGLGVSIILGRENYENIDFNSDLIVIDNLASSTIGRIDKFDDENEIMNYETYFKATFTVNFYGDNAENNSYRFINLTRSQKGLDLENELGITVYRPTSANNLKSLLGTQYFNRFEVEMVVMYSQNIDVDTLRIDTAQLEIINSK